MNSKQAHPFTSLSLSITMTTNSRALPRPALQRRPELRARGADAVGQLVQPGGAGVWVRRQRGRKGWGQKRDFFFSFSLKKKKNLPPRPPPPSPSLPRNVPVLYTAGNHESSTSPSLAEASFPGVDDGGECAQAYDRLLLQPKPSGQQFYW